MIDWPQLDELKQVLDVGETDAWDGSEDSGEEASRLTALLQAAIAKVKDDVGVWDEYEDLPDVNLNRAALRMAELMALKPEVVAAVGFRDPTYDRYLAGHRKSFGIA